MKILILSTKVDIATDAVLLELYRRGIKALRINTEDYPYHTQISTIQEGSSFFLDTHTGDGLPFHSCWYRRIRRPTSLDGMEPAVHEFCVREARAHIESVAINFSGRIMSHPQSIWTAERKLGQLQQAANVGLVIPRTVVSNNPAAILDAYKLFGGRMICKPLTTGHVEIDDGPVSIYTSQVLDHHLEHIADSALSPSIYQPLIDKRCDVRVTVVGKKLFVAEIDSQSDSDAIIDWRRGDVGQMLHREAQLPRQIEHQILEFMRKCNLQFGAIDLIRTPDDEYVFLEVNPNGQWLWLEDHVGFAISKAVADWLTGDD